MTTLKLFCLGASSQFGQITERVHRLAATSNFKMQLDPVGTTAPHLRDLLPDPDLLPFLYQQTAVMRISTEEIVVMLDDDHVAVTNQPPPRIDHRTVCRSKNRLTQLTGNINPFIQTRVRLETRY